MKDSIRVMIADDHTMFREGLRKLLEFAPGFEIVGEARDGLEAVKLAPKLKPQILLLDLAMPQQSGLESLPEIMRQTPQTRIIFLTASIETHETMEALRIGARGVVMKNAASELLVGCIHAVMAGDYCVGTQIIHNLHEYLSRMVGEAKKGRFGLTDREIEIVSAIVNGYSNRDIAHEFRISGDTVKHHLTNIFNKTGVSTRLELALFARNKKLPLVALR